MMKLTAFPLLLVASACGPDRIECPTTSEVVTYATVQPIFEEACGDCHATTLLTRAERDGAPKDINFDFYEDAKVDGRDAAKQVLNRTMPSDDPERLSEADACLIAAWVEQGMLE